MTEARYKTFVLKKYPNKAKTNIKLKNQTRRLKKSSCFKTIEHKNVSILFIYVT